MINAAVYIRVHKKTVQVEYRKRERIALPDNSSAVLGIMNLRWLDE